MCLSVPLSVSAACFVCAAAVGGDGDGRPYCTACIEVVATILLGSSSGSGSGSRTAALDSSVGVRRLCWCVGNCTSGAGEVICTRPCSPPKFTVGTDLRLTALPARLVNSAKRLAMGSERASSSASATPPPPSPPPPPPTPPPPSLTPAFITIVIARWRRSRQTVLCDGTRGLCPGGSGAGSGSCLGAGTAALDSSVGVRRFCWCVANRTSGAGEVIFTKPCSPPKFTVGTDLRLTGLGRGLCSPPATA